MLNASCTSNWSKILIWKKEYYLTHWQHGFDLKGLMFFCWPCYNIYAKCMSHRKMIQSLYLQKMTTFNERVYISLLSLLDSTVVIYMLNASCTEKLSPISNQRKWQLFYERDNISLLALLDSTVVIYMLNARRTEKWSLVPDKTNPLQIPLRKRETMFDQEKSWSKRRDWRYNTFCWLLLNQFSIGRQNQ